MESEEPNFYWIEYLFECGDIVKLREGLDCNPSVLEELGERSNSLLCDAVDASDLTAAALFLSRGANPNGAGDLEPPLIQAVELPDEDITMTFILTLLACGADLEKSSHRGTPLHVAVRRGRVDVADLLLKMGANVNAVATADGETPLWLAAFARNIEMVRLLLNFKANPSIPDTTSGLTPLLVVKRVKDSKSVLLEELLSKEPGL